VRRAATAALFAVTVAASAHAQTSMPQGQTMPPGPPMHMQHDPAHGPGVSASTREYQQAMERMHRDMDIPYTGDADRDFLAGMIPHHQGAIDTARVVLKYGHDPAIRKMARDIISAQEREIAQMQRMADRHH
jgi:uncharacterized protein (DUF305 family)